MLLQDLLQRHLAMQFFVQCHKYGAQPSLGVRSQHAEPLAVTGGRADAKAGGSIVLAAGLARGRSGADTGEGPLDVGVADAGEALARRAAGADGGQALLGAAAMLLEVPGDEDFDGTAIVGIKHAAIDQVPRDRPSLVATPDPEGVDELILVDQPILQRQQSKKKVAVGTRLGHGRASKVAWREQSPRANPRRSAEATVPRRYNVSHFSPNIIWAQRRRADA